MNASFGMTMPTSVVTPEQRALEAEAVALWSHPRVQGALAKVKALMLTGYGADVPAEATARFEAAMQEYLFSYVERVLCRDRNNFCLHYTCHPPYERADGAPVPGCRFYGENPDCFYRWGGLHADRRYRLTGRPDGPLPASVSFTLMSSYGGTTPGAALLLDDLEKAADGSFAITIDTDPANGRPNHMQMTPRTTLILIRDLLGDWAMDTPVALSLEAEGVTRGGPWDLEAAAEEIAFYAGEEVYLYFWMNHIYRNLQPNTLKGPQSAAALGGSAAMATAQGYFQLAEDQAIILNWDPADAAVSSISLLDWWFVPIAAHRLQSSLNNHMAATHADGTIMAVLSARDPGITNWIETDGLTELFLTGRWQDLPATPVREGARLTAVAVPFADLDGHLPQEMERCTPTMRAERHARRLAAYTRRTGSADSRYS